MKVSTAMSCSFWSQCLVHVWLKHGCFVHRRCCSVHLKLFLLSCAFFIRSLVETSDEGYAPLKFKPPQARAQLDENTYTVLYEYNAQVIAHYTHIYFIFVDDCISDRHRFNSIVTSCVCSGHRRAVCQAGRAGPGAGARRRWLVDSGKKWADGPCARKLPGETEPTCRLRELLVNQMFRFLGSTFKIQPRSHSKGASGCELL